MCFPHMAGDGAGVGIVAAASCGADDDSDGFAAIKIILRDGISIDKPEGSKARSSKVSVSRFMLFPFRGFRRR
jgi:hypothetical protein